MGIPYSEMMQRMTSKDIAIYQAERLVEYREEQELQQKRQQAQASKNPPGAHLSRS